MLLELRSDRHAVLVIGIEGHADTLLGVSAVPRYRGQACLLVLLEGRRGGLLLADCELSWGLLRIRYLTLVVSDCGRHYPALIVNSKLEL